MQLQSTFSGGLLGKPDNPVHFDCSHFEVLGWWRGLATERIVVYVSIWFEGGGRAPRVPPDCSGCALQGMGRGFAETLLHVVDGVDGKEVGVGAVDVTLTRHLLGAAHRTNI